MSELMSDSKSRTEPIILDNGTAMLVTHGAQLSQAQGVTALNGWGGAAADILPADRYQQISIQLPDCNHALYLE